MSDYTRINVAREFAHTTPEMHTVFGGDLWEFSKGRDGSMCIRRRSNQQVYTLSPGTWTAEGGKWNGGSHGRGRASTGAESTSENDDEND